MSLRTRYVDAVAADEGALAFVKWLALGVVLQLVFLIPLLPVVVSTLLLPEPYQPGAGSAVFALGFLCIRWFLFAEPCAEIGARKRRGSRPLWLAGGVVFGMFALALAGGLSPKKGA